MDEAAFQYAWKHLHFEFNNLITQRGKKIELINPGKWNSGPGPDFLEAEIRINGTRVLGAVELHLKPQDWFNHKHHLDEKYNSVILHVIPNQPISSDFVTLNSTNEAIELLHLKVLPFDVQLSSRPCLTTPINAEILHAQAEIANKTYLIQSVQNLLNHSDSLLGLEFSFKRSVILRLFEILGMPYHTETNLSLAHSLFEQFIHQKENKAYVSSPTQFSFDSLDLSFSEKTKKAARLAHFIFLQPLPVTLPEFESFYNQIKNVLHKQFGKTFTAPILSRNWLIVSCYAWASLVYSTKAMDFFAQLWKSSKSSIPGSLRKDVVSETLKKEMQLAKVSGYPNFLLDQQKSFCKKFECLRCKLTNHETAS